MLPGARSGPVGTPSGITDASSAKFGTKRAGNSVGADARAAGEPLAFAEGDEVIAPRDELARRVDAALEVVEAAGR